MALYSELCHTKLLQRYRTLRVWISNTVEDQPWQGDDLDVDAFDFSTNMDSSYRVKIEGRLLDEDDNEEDEDGSDGQVEDKMDAIDVSGDTVNEGMKGTKKKSKGAAPEQRYKFSHFFKAMTVE